MPLAFAPGASLYYDVTPKAVALSVIAAALCFFAAPAAVALQRSPFGERVLLLVALEAVALVLSTAFSTSPSGSISGSGWRRFGLAQQSALLLFFLIATDQLSRHSHIKRPLLRAVSITAILTALYALCQYFEFDPFIQHQLYSVGQFNQPILRPPATLGSGPGYGNFAMIAAFLSLAAWGLETSRFWRAASVLAAVLSAIGIILSGTRAAALGLVVGLAFLGFKRIRSITPRLALIGIAAAIALTIFYFSPAGHYVRNRTVQAAGDWKGGTRIWLWRDSLRMLAYRPTIGYGPDAFASQFPRFQSAELANAYPDTYNESPHNFILDTLLSQGFSGAPFLALIALALVAGWRSSRNSPMFAGLIALLVSFQFFSLEITTAAYLYFTLALLFAAELRPEGAVPTSSSIILRICEGWAAILLAIFALELAVSDWYFERTRKDLAAGNLLVSLRDFATARRWSPPGFDPSLWYSRELLNAARKANQFQAMFPEIEKSAWEAYRGAEDRHNACYHLVSVYTDTGQLERANSLNNECLALAPSWYLLYWSGASLNVSLHNYDQAERMAAQAVKYGGKHREEMLRVLEMVRSARDRKQ